MADIVGGATTTRLVYTNITLTLETRSRDRGKRQRSGRIDISGNLKLSILVATCKK